MLHTKCGIVGAGAGLFCGQALGGVQSEWLVRAVLISRMRAAGGALRARCSRILLGTMQTIAIPQPAILSHSFRRPCGTFLPDLAPPLAGPFHLIRPPAEIGPASAGLFLCAEHDRQLGAGSPLSSLMVAKD
jgi:hypothetical protein